MNGIQTSSDHACSHHYRVYIIIQNVYSPRLPLTHQSDDFEELSIYSLYTHTHTHIVRIVLGRYKPGIHMFRYIIRIQNRCI